MVLSTTFLIIFCAMTLPVSLAGVVESESDYKDWIVGSRQNAAKSNVILDQKNFGEKHKKVNRKVEGEFNSFVRKHAKNKKKTYNNLRGVSIADKLGWVRDMKILTQSNLKSKPLAAGRIDANHSAREQTKYGGDSSVQRRLLNYNYDWRAIYKDQKIADKIKDSYWIKWHPQKTKTNTGKSSSNVRPRAKRKTKSSEGDNWDFDGYRNDGGHDQAAEEDQWHVNDRTYDPESGENIWNGNDNWRHSESAQSEEEYEEYLDILNGAGSNKYGNNISKNDKKSLEGNPSSQIKGNDRPNDKEKKPGKTGIEMKNGSDLSEEVNEGYIDADANEDGGSKRWHRTRSHLSEDGTLSYQSTDIASDYSDDDETTKTADKHNSVRSDINTGGLDSDSDDKNIGKNNAGGTEEWFNDKGEGDGGINSSLSDDGDGSNGDKFGDEADNLKEDEPDDNDKGEAKNIDKSTKENMLNEETEGYDSLDDDNDEYNPNKDKSNDKYGLYDNKDGSIKAHGKKGKASNDKGKDKGDNVFDDVEGTPIKENKSKNKGDSDKPVISQGPIDKGSKEKDKDDDDYGFDGQVQPDKGKNKDSDDTGFDVDKDMDKKKDGEENKGQNEGNNDDDDDDGFDPVEDRPINGMDKNIDEDDLVDKDRPHKGKGNIDKGKDKAAVKDEGFKGFNGGKDRPGKSKDMNKEDIGVNNIEGKPNKGKENKNKGNQNKGLDDDDNGFDGVVGRPIKSKDKNKDKDYGGFDNDKDRPNKGKVKDQDDGGFDDDKNKPNKSKVKDQDDGGFDYDNGRPNKGRVKDQDDGGFDDNKNKPNKSKVKDQDYGGFDDSKNKPNKSKVNDQDDVGFDYDNDRPNKGNVKDQDDGGFDDNKIKPNKSKVKDQGDGGFDGNKDRPNKGKVKEQDNSGFDDDKNKPNKSKVKDQDDGGFDYDDGRPNKSKVKDQEDGGFDDKKDRPNMGKVKDSFDGLEDMPIKDKDKNKYGNDDEIGDDKNGPYNVKDDSGIEAYKERPKNNTKDFEKDGDSFVSDEAGVNKYNENRPVEEGDIDKGKGKGGNDATGDYLFLTSTKGDLLGKDVTDLPHDKGNKEKDINGDFWGKIVVDDKNGTKPDDENKLEIDNSENHKNNDEEDYYDYKEDDYDDNIVEDASMDDVVEAGVGKGNKPDPDSEGASAHNESTSDSSVVEAKLDGSNNSEKVVAGADGPTAKENDGKGGANSNSDEKIKEISENDKEDAASSDGGFYDSSEDEKSDELGNEGGKGIDDHEIKDIGGNDNNEAIDKASDGGFENYYKDDNVGDGKIDGGSFEDYDILEDTGGNDNDKSVSDEKGNDGSFDKYDQYDDVGNGKVGVDSFEDYENVQGNDGNDKYESFGDDNEGKDGFEEYDSAEDKVGDDKDDGVSNSEVDDDSLEGINVEDHDGNDNDEGVSDVNDDYEIVEDNNGNNEDDGISYGKVDDAGFDDYKLIDDNEGSNWMGKYADKDFFDWYDPFEGFFDDFDEDFGFDYKEPEDEDDDDLVESSDEDIDDDWENDNELKVEKNNDKEFRNVYQGDKGNSGVNKNPEIRYNVAGTDKKGVSNQADSEDIRRPEGGTNYHEQDDDGGGQDGGDEDGFEYEDEVDDNGGINGGDKGNPEDGEVSWGAGSPDEYNVLDESYSPAIGGSEGEQESDEEFGLVDGQNFEENNDPENSDINFVDRVSEYPTLKVNLMSRNCLKDGIPMDRILKLTQHVEDFYEGHTSYDDAEDNLRSLKIDKGECKGVFDKLKTQTRQLLRPRRVKTKIDESSELYMGLMQMLNQNLKELARSKTDNLESTRKMTNALEKNLLELVLYDIESGYIESAITRSIQLFETNPNMSVSAVVRQAYSYENVINILKYLELMTHEQLEGSVTLFDIVMEDKDLEANTAAIIDNYLGKFASLSVNEGPAAYIFQGMRKKLEERLDKITISQYDMATVVGSELQRKSVSNAVRRYRELNNPPIIDIVKTAFTDDGASQVAEFLVHLSEEEMVEGAVELMHQVLENREYVQQEEEEAFLTILDRLSKNDTVPETMQLLFEGIISRVTQTSVDRTDTQKDNNEAINEHDHIPKNLGDAILESALAAADNAKVAKDDDDDDDLIKKVQFAKDDATGKEMTQVMIAPKAKFRKAVIRSNRCYAFDGEGRLEFQAVLPELRPEWELGVSFKSNISDGIIFAAANPKYKFVVFLRDGAIGLSAGSRPCTVSKELYDDNLIHKLVVKYYVDGEMDVFVDEDDLNDDDTESDSETPSRRARRSSSDRDWSRSILKKHVGKLSARALLHNFVGTSIRRRSKRSIVSTYRGKPFPKAGSLRGISPPFFLGNVPNRNIRKSRPCLSKVQGFVGELREINMNGSPVMNLKHRGTLDC